MKKIEDEIISKWDADLYDQEKGGKTYENY